MTRVETRPTMLEAAREHDMVGEIQRLQELWQRRTGRPQFGGTSGSD